MPVVPQICSCDASRPRSLTSNWSPSADYPFGAKSQYGPTVKSTRHPEPDEGCLRQSTHCHSALATCRCVRPANTSTTRPAHDRLTTAACPMIRPCLQRVLPTPRRCRPVCVRSRTIRTSEAEDTFSTTCPPGLDRPSSKLSMSICLLPHILTQLIAQQFGQAAAAETPRTFYCRAVAGTPTSRLDAPSTTSR